MKPIVDLIRINVCHRQLQKLYQLLQKNPNQDISLADFGANHAKSGSLCTDLLIVAENYNII